MIRGGFGTSLRLVLGGWRWFPLLAVVAGNAAAGLINVGPLRLHGGANAWDPLVFGGITVQTFALLTAPAFLIGTSRDMNRSWEHLLCLRLRNRRSWWGTDILGLGAAAGLYGLAIGAGTFGLGLAELPFAFTWSALAQSRLAVGSTRLLVTLHSTPPWTVSLEMLGLLALGLWLLAVLARAATLLMKSQWSALALIWVVVLGQYVLVQMGLASIFPWGPGDQFVYLTHFATDGGGIPFSWTVEYGLALTLVGAVVGMAIAQRREWPI